MTMSFDDILADIAPVITNTLGESFVVISPSGTERPIVGTVDRNPPERITAGGRPTMVKMTILVNNSATTGIAASEFDRGGTWRARLAYQSGGELGEFGIFMPPPGNNAVHDAGHIEFDLH